MAARACKLGDGTRDPFTGEAVKESAPEPPPDPACERPGVITDRLRCQLSGGFYLVGAENAESARLQRSRSDRMNSHQNAHFTPAGRERLTGTRIAHDLAVSDVIVSRVLPATL